MKLACMKGRSTRQIHLVVVLVPGMKCPNSPNSQCLVPAIALIILILTCLPNKAIAYSFLEKSGNAKTASLGFAATALAEDSSTVYWNPAGLSEIGDCVPQLTVYKAFETNYVNLFTNHRVFDHPLSVGLIRAGVDGIVESVGTHNRVDRWIAGESFNYTGHALLIGTAFEILPALSLGIAGKVIHEDLYSNQALGMGADLGILYRINPDFRVGINYKNIIQPQLEWNTVNKTKETVPQEIAVGAVLNLLENKLLLSSDISKTTHRPMTRPIGAVYQIMDALVFRAGFETDSEKIKELGEQIQRLDSLSLGMGLNLGELQIDFSWSNPEQDFQEDVWRVTIGRRSLPALGTRH